jgi:hypothetical protein
VSYGVRPSICGAADAMRRPLVKGALHGAGQHRTCRTRVPATGLDFVMAPSGCMRPAGEGDAIAGLRARCRLQVDGAELQSAKLTT